MSGAEMQTAINALILYDQLFEKQIPSRKGRTINEQVGLIIRELGEFLEVEKHGRLEKQAEELIDFILSAATMAMVWYRNSGLTETEFLTAIANATESVDAKLFERWLKTKFDWYNTNLAEVPT